ncbi:MAG: hypothetical protein JSV51_04325 [Candidatus Bathyarchaeota archaeon]|nr:MAG: hypothetical protein JSV51_04325 [Candidatus Bathyarchaeota archaeon]
MVSDFPKRVYTADEVEKARKLVESGYKHRLVLKGNPQFKVKVRKTLKHVKTAKQYDFLRTYIKWIVEVDGFSQLHEAEAAIWANKQLLENPIGAAGFFVQKVFQMKEFLEGKLYYGGEAEARSDKERINFLRTLKQKSRDPAVRKECKSLLKKWAETPFP